MIDPRSASAHPFAITAALNHDHVRLTLAGEIDFSTAEQVISSVAQHLNQPQVTCLVADLDGVTFLDSQGLRALVVSHRHAHRLGKTFLVQGHHGDTAAHIEMAGLTAYLTEPTHRPDQTHTGGGQDDKPAHDQYPETLA